MVCKNKIYKEMNHMKRYIKKAVQVFILGLLVFNLSGCSDDDILLSVSPGEDTSNGESLRLISYNILEGMKLDKTNNYDNFVEWLKSYDPDIVALQEANGFTQESLEKLAARYNHPYVITNVKVGDNYPVALTSKYPLEKRRRVTKHVSHGCIFASIKGVNLVVTHLWPQGYWHQDGDGLGTEYRLHEMGIFLDSTINKFPMEPKWLLMGDFNAMSRIDMDGMDNPQGRDYRVHDMIMDAGFSDAVRHLHNYFHRTTPTVYGGWTAGRKGTRIDFIYGTDAMLRDVTKAGVIYDDFTDNFSDHYPVMVEFRY
ncbi:endonuclease/exonuclease/phosphatase family protein [Dysgonomonas sp. 511]|nr:endonuclease/exonuclease/phosphatase family protein [Dysgonomonas sp. 511]